jgi:hypothetical protein
MFKNHLGTDYWIVRWGNKTFYKWYGLGRCMLSEDFKDVGIKGFRLTAEQRDELIDLMNEREKKLNSILNESKVFEYQ